VLQGEVTGDPEHVVGLLRRAVPVAVSGSLFARATVRAGWVERGLALSRTQTSLWLIGTVEQTLRGTSLVHLEVRPSGSRWSVPTRANVIGLVAVVALALVALSAVVVTISVGGVIGYFFVLIYAGNVVLWWASTTSAVKRGARRVADAVGLAAP
jgi:hypothetical protein